jgi:hypothetical protein
LLLSSAAVVVRLLSRNIFISGDKALLAQTSALSSRDQIPVTWIFFTL